MNLFCKRLKNRKITQKNALIFGVKSVNLKEKMIKKTIKSELHKKTGFNEFSKFLAVGLGIDGWVKYPTTEFQNWDDLKQRFPETIKNLKCAGEWRIEIYQVENDYKIIRKVRGNELPNKGKNICSFGYMQAGEKNEVFISDYLIQFKSISLEKRIGYGPEIKIEIYENITTYIYNVGYESKEYTFKNYPGDYSSFLPHNFNQNSTLKIKYSY